MQCVEWSKSESSDRPSTIRGALACPDGNDSGLQPEASGESPVFARILLVLKIVSRRAHEMKSPRLGHVKDCCDRLGFPSDSLDRCVVEWTLEATEIEVEDVAHAIIVLPVRIYFVPSTSLNKSVAFATSCNIHNRYLTAL